MSRPLDWEGAINVRDVGGGRVRPGALIRAAAVDSLTEDGWKALVAYGVRTVIDLRNDDEQRPDAARRPSSVRTLRVPLDGVDDEEFWERWRSGPQFGTPLYYAPHLERMPERSVAVVRAIAHAPPGGVLFHCQGGRDRTGQTAMLVLDLLGVDPDAIADDYELSAATPEIEAFLARERTSAREIIVATLRDARRRLVAGGLTDADVEALRARALA